MAYTVLARRYRSGTFDEVVGQDHVAQTLKKAIDSGRIAHAYLFTGTRGVGKTSMARILAKALNCLNAKDDKPTTAPCGKCSSCEAIAKGEDIDVIEIDAASNTGVDNVRDLIENARFRPARSRFKVYIIDEVHMLSKAAFNALLKIMEEPPEHVKFILATTEAEKILPTILSRCQRYDFRNIPSREIVAHLQRIVSDEKVSATDEALQLVARAGAGSMRDSLSLLDRLLSVGEKKLTAESIEQLLGMPRATLIFDLAGAIGAGDVKSTLQQATAIVSGGLAVDTLIASLIEHFHNLLLVATCGAQSDLVDVIGVDAKQLEAQASQFDPGALTQDIAILEELRRQMRSSQTGRALLDATLARLAMSSQFASVGELISRLDGGGSAGAGSPRSAATAQKKTSELARGPASPAAPVAKPSIAEVSGAVADVVRELKTPPVPVQSGATPSREGEAPAEPATRHASPADARPPTPEAIGEARTPDAASIPNDSQSEIEPSGDPHPSPPPQAGDGDEVDALPAVGKVADAGATSSLWQAYKKAAPKPIVVQQKDANGERVSPEPAELTPIREQVLQKLKGRLAGMFDAARLLSLDHSTGQALVWYPHEMAFAGEYLLSNLDAYASAFAEVIGRPARIEVQIEPAPVVDAGPATSSQRGPRVVRPSISEVEAMAPVQDESAPVAFDPSVFASDPLIKAILDAFPNSRIYPPR
jgi:DNA polymerase-3 subunit gamma/tau